MKLVYHGALDITSQVTLALVREQVGGTPKCPVSVIVKLALSTCRPWAAGSPTGMKLELLRELISGMKMGYV